MFHPINPLIFSFFHILNQCLAPILFVALFHRTLLPMRLSGLGAITDAPKLSSSAKGRFRRVRVVSKPHRLIELLRFPVTFSCNSNLKCSLACHAMPTAQCIFFERSVLCISPMHFSPPPNWRHGYSKPGVSMSPVENVSLVFRDLIGLLSHRQYL